MPENGIATLQGISGDTLSGSFASETCMLNATNLQTWGYNASSTFLVLSDPYSKMQQSFSRLDKWFCVG